MTHRVSCPESILKILSRIHASFADPLVQARAHPELFFISQKCIPTLATLPIRVGKRLVREHSKNFNAGGAEDAEDAENTNKILTANLACFLPDFYLCSPRLPR